MVRRMPIGYKKSIKQRGSRRGVLQLAPAIAQHPRKIQRLKQLHRAKLSRRHPSWNALELNQEVDAWFAKKITK